MSRRVATITLNPAYDLVGYCPEIERVKSTWCKRRVFMPQAKVLMLPKC